MRGAPSYRLQCNGSRSLFAKTTFCLCQLFWHTEPQVFHFEEYQMTNKAVAILMVGAFAAAGAMAQQTTPPGVDVPLGTPGIVTNPQGQKAQSKVEMRKQGEVALPTGDKTQSAEAYPSRAEGKAGTKAQANVKKREARHPNKMAPKEGVTPQSPGAK